VPDGNVEDVATVCGTSGYVVVPSIISEAVAAAAAFENCVEMWLKMCDDILSVRRNVSRKRFNDELGAGVVVGVAGEVDGESSPLSWRTNKSSVLIALYIKHTFTQHSQCTLMHIY